MDENYAVESDEMPLAVEPIDEDLQRGVINILRSDQAEDMSVSLESQADDDVMTLGLSGSAHAMTLLARISTELVELT